MTPLNGRVARPPSFVQIAAICAGHHGLPAALARMPKLGRCTMPKAKRKRSPAARPAEPRRPAPPALAVPPRPGAPTAAPSAPPSGPALLMPPAPGPRPPWPDLPAPAPAAQAVPAGLARRATPAPAPQTAPGPAPAAGQEADEASPPWVAKALEHLLVVTCWLDPGDSGEAFGATVRFSGRRTGVTGRPGP